MVATHVTHVVCFGDSTSDNGAGFRLTSELVGRPQAPAEAFVLAAPPAYPDGRFTNGPTAVEVLARQLDAALTDFAVGGALSGRGNCYAWIDRFASTGLLAQVDAYLTGLEGTPADPLALHVVQMAGNDYYTGWVELPAERRPRLGDLARQVVSNECEAVRRLALAGARRILVVGVKNLGVCPWEVAAGLSGAAGGFTVAMKERLPRALEELAGACPAEVRYFDLVDAWRRIRVAASSYGLRELHRPYELTSPDFVPGSGDPDEYFFWDESHVTAAVHRVLGERMAAALPPEWAGSALASSA